MGKEREVVWWPDEKATLEAYFNYGSTLTSEEKRNLYEEKKKEFVEKYPNSVIYAN